MNPKDKPRGEQPTTDDLGEDALANIKDMEEEYTEKVKKMEHLKAQFAKADAAVDADSIMAGYDEDTDLGHIELYYEFYDDEEPREAAAEVDTEETKREGFVARIHLERLSNL